MKLKRFSSSLNKKLSKRWSKRLKRVTKTLLKKRIINGRLWFVVSKIYGKKIIFWIVRIYRIGFSSWFMVKKKKRRFDYAFAKILIVVAINFIVNSNGCILISEGKVLSFLFGRNFAVGFKNEKNCFDK